MSELIEQRELPLDGTEGDWQNKNRKTLKSHSIYLHKINRRTLNISKF